MSVAEADQVQDEKRVCETCGSPNPRECRYETERGYEHTHGAVAGKECCPDPFHTQPPATPGHRMPRPVGQTPRPGDTIATPGRAGTERRWTDDNGVEWPMTIRKTRFPTEIPLGFDYEVVPESSLTAAIERVSEATEQRDALIADRERVDEDREQLAKRVRELEGAIEKINKLAWEKWPEDEDARTQYRRRLRNQIYLALQPVSPSTQPTPQTCPTCGSGTPSVCCFRAGNPDPHPHAGHLGALGCCPDSFHSQPTQDPTRRG